jgi:hypothetical protein
MMHLDRLDFSRYIIWCKVDYHSGHNDAGFDTTNGHGTNDSDFVDEDGEACLRDE